LYFFFFFLFLIFFYFIYKNTLLLVAEGLGSPWVSFPRESSLVEMKGRGAKGFSSPG
jgi:hypothetical protein